VRSRGTALAAVAAVAAALVLPSPASALVTGGPNGRIGYLPLDGAGARAPRAAGAAGLSNISYQGGPVMHSNTEYGIFWAPAGFSFPAGYEAAMGSYLRNVAADATRPTNVYSVGTQYTDASGAHAAYGTNFGATFDDVDAYPANLCPGYGPFAKCVTDSQLAAEVDAFVSAHSLPRGLTSTYFVFLPPTVGSCFGNGPPSSANPCFDTAFCAYHSDTAASGTETLYANISDGHVDPGGCGTGQYPSGSAASGGADDTISGLSHEANEMITDPLGDAWFVTAPGPDQGFENGDKCRTGAVSDFGAPLGGAAGALFNQLIGFGRYYLQQEWSNAAGGCEQRYRLTAQATGPSAARAARAVSFSGRGTDSEGGTITAVAWEFGDGSSAGGATVSHTYPAPGRYQVTVAVTNSTGLTATAAGPTVTVSPASSSFALGKVRRNRRRGTASLAVTVPAAGTLTLSGKGVRSIDATPASPKAVGAGTVGLAIKPTARTRRRLARRGRATVTAEVTYRPTGGSARRRAKRIKLVERS
jgi:PKD domain-containing protein